MHEIIPGLFLGDAHDARDIENLCANKVFCVVNATRLDVGFHPDLPSQITRIRVPIDDNGNRDHDFDLFSALTYVIHRIDIHLFLGHSVLIHCLAGRQRSAAVLASYLIWRHNLSVESSIEFIRSKKRDAFFPEANFVRSLQMWHARCNDIAVSLPSANTAKQKTYLVN